MTSYITISLSPTELTELIEEAVLKSLSGHRDSNLNNEPPISRKELTNRLNLSEPTIIRWEQKGKIPSLRIGGSVRYNWKAVLEALETKKKSGGLKK